MKTFIPASVLALLMATWAPPGAAEGVHGVVSVPAAGRAATVVTTNPGVRKQATVPAIGVSKQMYVAGMSGSDIIVKFQVTVSNLGNQIISDLAVADDLDSVFGAGNYTPEVGPVQISRDATLNFNSNFDGSTDQELLSVGESLAPTEFVVFEFSTRVTTVTDQGNGFGIYHNQVTVTGLDENNNPVSDLSTEGPDPDPDNNDDPGDNSDVSVVDLSSISAIGVAETTTVLGTAVTFDVYLEAFGGVTLDQVSAVQDLDSIFGPGNYTLSAAVALIDDPGTLTLNPAFDGSSDARFFTPVSSLAAGDTAHIQFEVTVDTLADQGNGLGVYSAQAIVQAALTNGIVISDVSDAGTDADPNGNGLPNDPNEDDATPFTVGAVVPPATGPVIGLSKQMYLSGTSGANYIVTTLLTVSNLGDQTLSELAIVENLDNVFGAGNYLVNNAAYRPEQVGGEGALNYNSAFNGSTVQDLLSTGLPDKGGSLAPGESVVFRFSASVSVLSDQGFGDGVYHNQVTVTGVDEGSNPVSDVSTEGPDPDPDNNGDPSDNSDVSVVDLSSVSAIGAAQTATVVGNQVTFDLYLEGFGSVTLNQVTASQELDAVFGAGNYSLSGAPSFIIDPGTLTLNPSFDGSTDIELFQSGDTLAAGATAHIQFVVDIISVVNRGAGVGVYSAQTTVSTLLANGLVITDASDSGTDPDPNANGIPYDANENDVTTFTVDAGAKPGLAKDATVIGNTVTFDFYLRNYGASTAGTVSVIDDLDAVFGAGNYTVSIGPVLIDDPGTLILNSAYDGSAESDLLLPGSSTLVAADTAQIQVGVDITHVADVGNGVGAYLNQATLSAIGTNGIVLSDISDNGTNPDSNGNSDPSGIDESDPTPVVVGAKGIGLARHSTVQGTQIIYDLYIENLGNVPITSMTLADQLLTVFGFGNYSKSSGPTLLVNPGTITLNPSFDGLFSSTIISSGTLAPHAKAQIRYVINVTNVTDQGSGFGIYPYQSTISANDALGVALTDPSDDGVLVDANGNGNANEAGENDTTTSTIGEEAALGVASTATAVADVVTIDVYLENLSSSQTANSVSVIDHLDQTFGAGNYTITSAPTFVDDPGTLTLNPTFDGTASPDLISTGTLTAGDTAQISYIVRIDTVADLGGGTGNYSHQVVASGTAGSTTYTADFSDNGTDPDPNGNRVPSDLNENDPSLFQYADARIGVAKQANVSGAQVTFDYFIENLGSETLQQISVGEDLDAVFGVGNYEIASAPVLVGAQHALDPNPGFDGSGSTDLVAAGSTMAASQIEQIRLVVNVLTVIDQGSGMGVYSNQVTASAVGASSSGLTSDLSDSGSDPDPNGNGLPDEAGENDPTNFQVGSSDVAISVVDGAAIAVPGQSITYTTTATNIGNATATNVAIASTFDTALASCSTTSVAAGGAAGNSAGPFAGAINDTGMSLPVGGTLTYTSVCLIPSSATGALNSSVDISTDTLEQDLVNNTASDGASLVPEADVAITKTDGLSFAAPGQAIDYFIVASNLGPSDAPAGSVTDTLPAALQGATWTCAGAGGGSCTASGSGNINDAMALPAGGSVTYTVSGTIDSGLLGTLSNTAAVSAGSVTDSVPGNNSATDDTEVVVGALVTGTKSVSGDFLVGGIVSYEIVLTNTGSGAQQDNPTDEFSDTVPAGLAVTNAVATSGTASAVGNLVTWNGTIAPAGSVTITITATVTAVSGTSIFNQGTIAFDSIGDGVNDASDVTDDPNVVGASDPTVFIAGGSDVSIVKSDSLNFANPGQSTSYTLVVSNAGPGDAPAATVVDTLPVAFTGATWTCVGSGSGTCPAGGSGNINELVGLPNGGSVTFTVSGTIDAAFLGTLSNTATVNAGTADPNSANDTSVDTTEVVEGALISGTKSVSGDFSVGGIVSYQIVLTNTGSGAQQDNPTDEFSDTVPAGLTVTNAVATSGSASAVGNLVTWNGTIAPAGSVTITITAQITAGDGTLISNQATINFDSNGDGTNDASQVTDDPNVAGGGDATAFVVGGADVSITKTDGLTTANPGQTTSYTLVASNAGPGTAPAAVVTDTLPAAFTGASWTCAGAAGGTCAANGIGNLNEVVGLPSGASVTFTINGTVDAAFLGTLTNTATVDAVVADLNPGNNSAQDDTEIVEGAVVTATKSVSGDLYPSGLATWQIVLANTGGTQADNPGDELVDIIPSELVLENAVASSGIVTITGNQLSWNGAIPADGSVTITVETRIVSAVGSTVTNQATVNYDSTGDGSNDASTTSDDPGVAGANDVTSFVVAPLGVRQMPTTIPALDPLGKVLLLLAMMGLAGLVLRRR